MTGATLDRLVLSLVLNSVKEYETPVPEVRFKEFSPSLAALRPVLFKPAGSWSNRFMDRLDVLLLMLLAVADLALFTYLRRRSARRVGSERVIISLRLHLRETRGLDRAYRPVSQVS